MSNNPRGRVQGQGQGRGRGGSFGGDRSRGRGGFSQGRGQGQQSSVPLIFAAGTSAKIDERLSDVDQLVSSLKNLGVTTRFPPRPGYGKLGKPVTVRANFFPIRIPKGPVYDYDVKTTPASEGRVKARILVLLELHPDFVSFVRHIAHDKSNRLVSAKRLPQPLAIPIPFFDEGQPGPKQDAKLYTVTITFTQELDTGNLIQYLDGESSRNFNPLPLISALNIVIQAHASRTAVRLGSNRYFFPSSSETREIGPALEARKGFITSVRPTYKQLMVNINGCFSAFHIPGNLADAILTFQRHSFGASPHKWPKYKVSTTYLGRKQRRTVSKIMGTSANQTFFNCDEFGGKISVEQYFKKKYQITLNHANDLPVVNLGTPDKAIYIPAELCTIEPMQHYAGRLGERETAAIIKYALKLPSATAQSIVTTGLPALAFTPETLGYPMTEFGISIGSAMTVIPGRELPPPKLTYKSGPQNVSDGSWNILNSKFHQGATVTSWWLLVVRDANVPDKISDNKDPRLRTLVERFGDKCNKSGMNFPKSLPDLLFTEQLPPLRDDPFRERAMLMIRRVITQKLMPGRKPTFILVLLSGFDNYIYPGIKRIGDVEVGVHTVHMLISKVFRDEKKQDQYFSNVALKLNTKLGGLNHVLDQDAMKWLRTKKTMLVGIDVTHPGKSSVLGTPSIAAVVASVDDNMVQFPASMKLQDSQDVKEMVTDLEEMMYERLSLYLKRNRQLPNRIIVFRDGVSEGQYEIVLEKELPQILSSFQRFSKGTSYRPSLTIVICGKRHHARFFPTDSHHADRNGNTRPGTVVDKGVTAVYEFDFYLQAHAGLQGTVRPTHYVVIYDENKLGADELQQGTHTASYLYGRATKSVSLIPAAYYADLACERGRLYINDFLNLGDDKSSVRSKNADPEEEKLRVFREAKARWGNGLHPDLAESMFYM